MTSLYSSDIIIGMMTKAFKKKLQKYFENDFEVMVNDDGEYEVYNEGGGIEDVFSKEWYFNRVKGIENFEDLEVFWKLIGGEKMFGVGCMIDDVLRFAEED